MSDSSDPSDTPLQLPGSRAVVLLAALTNTIAFFTGINAADALFLLRTPEPTGMIPASYTEVIVRVVWGFDHAHRHLMVALYCARVVLSGLLFMASTRVVLRVPDAGRLWRQAVIAGCVCATSTLVTEAHFAHERAVMFRTQYRLLHDLPWYLRQLPLEDAARSATASFSVGPFLVLGILLGILVFAGRNSTRAITG